MVGLFEIPGVFLINDADLVTRQQIGQKNLIFACFKGGFLLIKMCIEELFLRGDNIISSRNYPRPQLGTICIQKYQNQLIYICCQFIYLIWYVEMHEPRR